MQRSSLNPEEVIAAFKRNTHRFYFLNMLIMGAIVGAAWITKDSGFAKGRFVVLTSIFLIWIFNADKLYRCPSCGEAPRGNEGLIHLPKRCAACNVRLR